MDKIKILENKLIIPKRLAKKLKWSFPFYKIPKLDDYSQKIIEFSKENNKLPFYAKFDINNDGREEIMIIQISFFNKIGRLVIISFDDNEKPKFETIRWRGAVNALFFDYLIDIAQPKTYQIFGFSGKKSNKSIGEILKTKEEEVTVKYPHIITKGYNKRIVYWDGKQFCHTRIL